MSERNAAVFPLRLRLTDGTLLNASGLTKREYFSSVALTRLDLTAIADALNSAEPDTFEFDDGAYTVPPSMMASRIARAAVLVADALLLELSK